ncbi:biotin-dependent carboxyltransferase family protein [Vreelandella janggokensis]|uniref:5-oxoprolinase subunit C family protein n=1 Tax=Vreelandella janggokensis TaxID=370767 RepID=UPI0028667980|nr:biotin-dependent carboxyltransferase family protein [Halomonas janggokensis]MDR5886015.1 biotin-dependent carboxyltransferase family protein [Halomonas janggokensis]
MSQAGLVVKKAGPLALVQDAGRFGVGHLGVTQGGAADWIAFHWANWLLGNPLNSAALEIVMGGGLTLEAEDEVTLALAGADLAATLDGKPLAPNASFSLRSGQELAFKQPRQGLRAYLAFPGGLDAPEVLGSRSCTVREQLGGLQENGQPLMAGERLTWRGSSQPPRTLPENLTPLMPTSGCRLPIVLGSQVASFSGNSLYQAFNTPWQVDNRADRMGIRLTGPVLGGTLKGIVSEGIPLGAVQVPPDGQPIVLMNDRQTIGGYPRLGALTPIACATLAQCLPGTQVWLTPVSVSQAQAAYRRQFAHWIAD